MPELSIEARIRQLRRLGPHDLEAHLIAVFDEAMAAADRRTRRTLGVVRARGDVLTGARFAVEMLDDPSALAATPEGVVHLELMRWALRPALPVTGGRVEVPSSSMWSDLGEEGDVTALVGGACRIDAGPTMAERVQVGSGCAIESPGGETVVVTNRHVVAGAAAIPRAGGSPRLWAAFAEDPRTDANVYALDGDARVGTEHDVAAMATDALPPHVAMAAPSDLALEDGDPVAVVGHPYFDARFDREALAYGFVEPAGVLRISPGHYRGVEERSWNGHSVPIVLHDATTLSGSSGSVVIHMRSGCMIGLHVGGWPVGPGEFEFEVNAAVPVQHVVAYLSSA